MTGAKRLVGGAAALLAAVMLMATPAKAQFGGFAGASTGGGGQDMMTQMAPMLEVMKTKMGKKRFAMMMQTMGPMMSQMTQSGGFGGFGGGFSPAALGAGSGFDAGSIMGMVGPVMQMANLGGGLGRHRRHRPK